jgi:hypothetical protein
MSQRLTLHVGVNKTGSSAIQTFLEQNRELLRAQGVVVPDENIEDTPSVAGHHLWYFDREDGSVADRTAELTAKVDAMFSCDEVSQVVISAENLSNSESCAFKWFSEIARRHDVEVVVYLRRQDEFLLSSWQQWFLKAYPDLWTWLISCVGVTADWRVVLERWQSVVGRQRIRARLYESGRLHNGDVVADFAQFLLEL